MVWTILTPPERRDLIFLTPAVMCMALFETAGVASIVPFLGLLSDPTLIERKEWLARAYAAGSFTSRPSFFFAVGLAMLSLVTVGNVVSALTSWGLLRFSWMRNHSLSTRLLVAYMRQPYEFFLDKNSADLGRNILSEVQAVVTGIIIQGLQLIARFVVVAAVTATLFVIHPAMAAGILAVFGGVYGGLYLLVRRHIARAGRERVMLNQIRHKVAQESLAGVKELKLYGLTHVAANQFSNSSRELAARQANNAVIGQVPRYALETIALGGVLVIVLYLLRSGRHLEEVMPIIGLYAFAAYRMLPALQTIFAGITTLRFNLAALNVLQADLDAREAMADPMATETRLEQPVRFVGYLRAESVAFRYREATRMTLEDVDLEVGAGDWVAVVGPTGSGKSTLVDVLLGLIPPHSGRVLVDGVVLADEALRRAWQRNLAYVPQQIFLIDDTIIRNIAFGLADGEVDTARVEEAARVAQIHDFIVNEMPNGYATRIGERGIRLSGGQRQRIGIARALYRRPALLVLDEATSALDHQTEAAFFSALKAESKRCAVVSIAHRLSTTRSFNRIYVLERGRVIDEGRFEELALRSSHFKLAASELFPESPAESFQVEIRA